MSRTFLILLLGCFFFGLNSFAKTHVNFSVDQVVDQYYELKVLGLYTLNKDSKHNDCRPANGEACLTTACENLRSYECDEFNEIQQIRRACRGNWGDDCLRASMNYLKSFEYDEFEEMISLANSCRGVYGRECIQFTCERLGSFGCDDIEEIIEVNRACSGARR